MTRSTSDSPPSVTTTAEHRVPTQERGTRRVETILDAAAELVSEVGVEGITVQLLAERSKTSKGSLYHFFPDVTSVLRALAERHFHEIESIAHGTTRDESIDWQSVPADEVVARILAPLDYLEKNCDLLALVRAPQVLPRSARSMQPMLELVEHVLNARFPHMESARVTARAAMIVAVIDGAVTTATRGCSINGSHMRRELEELLAVYFQALA